MSQTTTRTTPTNDDPMTCSCCGGSLPPYAVWMATRDDADECTGSCDTDTGRCRAFAADDLWAIDDETALRTD